MCCVCKRQTKKNRSKMEVDYSNLNSIFLKMKLLKCFSALLIWIHSRKMKKKKKNKKRIASWLVRTGNQSSVQIAQKFQILNMEPVFSRNFRMLSMLHAKSLAPKQEKIENKQQTV